MADTPQTPPKADPETASLPSPRVTVQPADGADDDDERPKIIHTKSDPPALETFSSPMRQHRRTPSAHREVKETLNARVEMGNDDVDGSSFHRINQYVIMEEIGRGSYGSVHIAKDQYGTEYAVKEFSKTRLRKRAQSHILRQGPSGPQRSATGGSGRGALSPQMGGLRLSEQKDALFFIREEIAIMKKLNHPNLVQLIEVLDDPEEDSLYMVLEMCKKGVVMKVGLEESADPYSDEICRHWFRDLMLGIEYLHSHGVIHRDIKPDNLLLSDDQVLKIVDFGVSEMFEKQDDMKTAKTAGSPAFLPPELCGKHAEVSGTAADIWSMGICLYCLKYGHIPFKRDGVLAIYEAITTEEPLIPEDEDPLFVDLMSKILDKNPQTRITMPELREHPWVTKNGTDVLLSAEENCEYNIEPPNELEINRAFTRKMNHLFYVMRAIHRFKTMLAVIRARNGARDAPSPPPLNKDELQKSKEAAEQIEIEELLSQRRDFLGQGGSGSGSGDKGHARDVGEQEPQFLGIGTGSRDAFAQDEATPDVVADSPTAVDYNIYDRAYEEAIRKGIESKPSQTPVMYLTKFVKETEHFQQIENLISDLKLSSPTLKQQVKDSAQHMQNQFASRAGGSKLAQLVSKFGGGDGATEEKKPETDESVAET